MPRDPEATVTHSIVDSAIAVLRATPAVTVPIAELAAQLETLPEHLGEHLADDPRVLVVEPPAIPGLAATGARRAEYDRALRAAGLLGVRRVALVQRERPETGAAVDALLRHTAVRLLAPHDPGAARAADRTNRAVMAALRGAGALSTTRPPRPRQRPRDPPHPPRPEPPAPRRS